MKYSAIIVDDEAMVVDLLTELINEECEGLDVAGSAGNLPDAIQLIEQNNPDLIFLDINLPSANGMQILDHFPTRHFEVVFITGYTTLESLARRYKPLGILSKPIDNEELRSVYDEFLSRDGQETKEAIHNESLQ